MTSNLLSPSVLISFASILGVIGALWASHQKAQFERELRQKSEEITELTRQTLDTITGGKSFVYLTISSLSSETNLGLLVFIHQGEHPLYEVHARIVDLEKFDQLKNSLSLETFMLADTNLSIGTLVPNYVSHRGRVMLGPGPTRRFNIFFTARNGGVTQLLRFTRHEGQWVSATRVTRDQTNEVLLENVHKDFPRNVKGEVDW